VRTGLTALRAPVQPAVFGRFEERVRWSVYGVCVIPSYW
jgi:hypothetical protein